MKRPHCAIDFHASEKKKIIGSDSEGYWGIGFQTCSACSKLIVRIFASSEFHPAYDGWGDELVSYLVRPKVAGRDPIPLEVPAEYAEDYTEACLVLSDSPKASAALSRRGLQHILRGKANVKHSDLYQEIQEILNKNMLPSHVAESLDAVRNIGNFAAHPLKSKSTGEIVDVEAGEAEWNLDVIEALFDFFFVTPAKILAKKTALNQKLIDLGKPPIK